METGIKSSFIPQTPITPTATARRRGGSFDFLLLIAIVFLVASVTLAAGVFLYAQYLNSAAASKVDQLQRAQAAFEPSLIAQLTRLDDRMRAADLVLGTHMAPTTLFHLLEQLTLQTVAFSSLDFVVTTENTTLAMQGLAKSVNSIALQADLFSKHGTIVSPIFSNIDRQLDGVHFELIASVNPSNLKFAALVRQAQRGLEQPAPAEATSSIPQFAP